jgi:hypothetical protein
MFPSELLLRSLLVLCIIGSLGEQIKYLPLKPGFFILLKSNTSVGTLVNSGIVAADLHHDINDAGQNIDILIMVVPLLITNVFATGLIGYKAW